jgi:hypothetical protein
MHKAMAEALGDREGVTAPPLPRDRELEKAASRCSTTMF